MSIVRTTSFVVWSLLVVPAAVLAQSSLTGVVRDPSGAVLPGATVEASSPALIEQIRSVQRSSHWRYLTWSHQSDGW